MGDDAKPSPPVAAIAIDAGDLSLGGGLLSLVRPALLPLEPGGVLSVHSSHRGAVQDLPSWCRAEGHTYLEGEEVADGKWRHFIARGARGVWRGAREWGMRLQPKGDALTAADLLDAVPMPAQAQVDSGFAPRGAQVEPGGPDYPFGILERDHAAPPEVARLYDQALTAQWDAARDIAWAQIPDLPIPIEAAVGQVMTFLAENELSALYVPSRFVSQLHPAYVEVAMFLSTQMIDEARHIDVFLKRARAAGGGVGVSSAITSASLLTLLQQEDFTVATFLLSVLGEGTFLDLLRYIERFAPDPVTADIARRARADEARHVHFGLAHVRHALAHDETLYPRLEGAVRQRAATLQGAGGVPAPIQDALVLLAAGDPAPAAVARGHEAFRELLDTMHEGRIKRLLKAGFSEAQAQTLSDLHTPNFM